MSKKRPFTDQEALLFHALPKPGKLEIVPSKPMDTQRDLSLDKGVCDHCPLKLLMRFRPNWNDCGHISLTPMGDSFLLKLSQFRRNWLRLRVNRRRAKHQCQR